jgi:hypothetical protein
MNTPTPETSVLEIMPDQQKEILAVVQQNALPQEQALSLQTSFAPLFKEAGALIAQSRGIVVTDASQVAQIKLSREYRLLIRQVRIKGEKTRKELKEASLRTGKAIDAMNTILVHTLGDEETRLEEQEKIVERAEQARKDALKSSRESALKPYGTDTAFLALGEMPDATFAQLLENARAGHEAKLAAARQAEEAKIAAENARLKEAARIREENERLKREADEREAAAKIEREAAAQKQREADALAAKIKAEAAAVLAAERAAAQAEAARIKAEADAAAKLAADKAKAEREAAELIASQERAKAAKLEAEAKSRADAEKAAIAAEQAAARKAAAAPDKAKVAAFAMAIRSVAIPELHVDNSALSKVLAEQRAKFADWIEAKASQL